MCISYTHVDFMCLFGEGKWKILCFFLTLFGKFYWSLKFQDLGTIILYRVLFTLEDQNEVHYRLYLKKIAYRKMNGNYRDFHNSPPIPPLSSILNVLHKWGAFVTMTSQYWFIIIN